MATPKKSPTKAPPVVPFKDAHVTFTVIGGDDPPRRVRLGAKVKDRVTGYTGIVTARIEYLYATSRVCIQAKSRGSKVPEPLYTDEVSVYVVTTRET